MAWSDPTARSTGDLITAAIWNQDVVDNSQALYDWVWGGIGYFCDVARSASQSISGDTDTAISFDTEVTDTDNMWSSGTPTRVSIPVSGVYIITGQVNAEAGTAIKAWVRLNGTTEIARGATYGNAKPSCPTPSRIIALSANDYLELLTRAGAAFSATLCRMSVKLLYTT